MSDGDAIIIDQLHKHYGQVQALKGVSLTVKRGEIFGLLGANGAGKTTLIKTLVGSSRPHAGSVNVLGLNPFKQTREVRRQMGYMPQTPVLYEDLSPRDNILFFGRAHRIDNLNQRVDAVLDFTELRQRQDDPVYGFSGGMKQRASLACALVHQPRVLLLDEPTTGIDPKLREAFWAYFRGLAANDVTLIISTHQMDEALYCDRLAVMRDGKILACDTPRELMRRGSTTVKVWMDGKVETETITNYPERLPEVLRRYQLDNAIERIEIQEDTLETVVLDLIKAQEKPEENHVVYPQ